MIGQSQRKAGSMLSLSEHHVTIANHGISRFLNSLAYFLAHLLHLFSG
jgi:hypothetical protein